MTNRIGWLQSLNGKDTLRFRSYPNPTAYWGTLTEIIKGEVIPGQHPLLKTKRVVFREEALKEWKGWQRSVVAPELIGCLLLKHHDRNIQDNCCNKQPKD
jgi:hypothetical protein